MAVSKYIKDLRAKIGTTPLIMPAVSAIILNDAGEVLLHRSSDDGQWYTIGGAMDPLEEPAAACVREALEETGLHIEPLRLLAVQTAPPVIYPNGDQVLYVGISFHCRPIGGTLRVADDESLEVRYFSRDSLPELRPDQKKRVELAYEDRPAYFVRPDRADRID